MSEFYSSGDYAGLDTKKASFYFGYEESVCGKCGAKSCEDHEDEASDDWCFVAKLAGKETIIPASKLGVNDKFDVMANLAAGMAVVIDGLLDNGVE